MNDELSNKPSEPSITEDLGKTIKREGRQIAGEAKTTARKMATSQRDALADYITALAAAAGRGAEDLEASGYGRSAATVARAADDVDGFVDRLRAREPGDIWDDVEGFARDHPALLFGASFALAFGATRFLKSSASHDGPRYSEATGAHDNKVSSGGA